ncbi:hypothetical protein ACFL1V_10480, partial [Pseudomonadota bacterium]
GSARGDFQGENRGLMVHDCRDAGGRAVPGAIAEDVPSARSRSGGFLTEGSRKAGLAWDTYTTRAVEPPAKGWIKL